MQLCRSECSPNDITRASAGADEVWPYPESCRRRMPRLFSHTCVDRPRSSSFRDPARQRMV